MLCLKEGMEGEGARVVADAFSDLTCSAIFLAARRLTSADLMRAAAAACKERRGGGEDYHPFLRSGGHMGLSPGRVQLTLKAQKVQPAMPSLILCVALPLFCNPCWRLDP